MNKKPVILCIDDMVTHLQAIGNALKDSDYEVSMITKPLKCIEIAKNIKPDVIMLDIMMPEITGIELCKLLKDDPETNDIPIIFLTSQKEVEYISQAFEAGGADYIFKPANKTETLLRINTQLKLRKSQFELKEALAQLQNTILEKNELLTIVSQDLRKPINDIKDWLNMLVNIDFKNQFPEVQKYSKNIDLNLKNLMNIINDFLYLNDIDHGTIKILFKSFNLDALIKRVMKEYDTEAKTKRLVVSYNNYIASGVITSGDSDKIEKIISNILSNAIKFSTFYKKIEINTNLKFVKNINYFTIEIKDQGMGMSESTISKIFTKNANKQSQSEIGKSSEDDVKADIGNKEENNESSNFGLPIVKKLLDRIGGFVTVRSELSKGSSFVVHLPLKIPKDIVFDDEE